MKIICELCHKEILEDEIYEVDAMTFHEEDCLMDYLYQHVTEYSRDEYMAGMIELERKLSEKREVDSNGPL